MKANVNFEMKGFDLSLSPFKEVIIKEGGETHFEGVFAAGDVTNVPEKQIIIAAAEGAKTALSVASYINHLK